MPIDRRDYALDWRAISHRIRFVRAGGRCERCGAPHGEMIERSATRKGAPDLYRLADGRTFRADTGAYVGVIEFAVKRRTRVKLMTAHLNHDPSDNDDDNLGAFCQRCHFMHDRKNNARRKKYGRLFIAKSVQIQFSP